MATEAPVPEQSPVSPPVRGTCSARCGRVRRRARHGVHLRALQPQRGGDAVRRGGRSFGSSSYATNGNAGEAALRAARFASTGGPWCSSPPSSSTPSSTNSPTSRTTTRATSGRSSPEQCPTPNTAANASEKPGTTFRSKAETSGRRQTRARPTY